MQDSRRSHSRDSSRKRGGFATSGNKSSLRHDGLSVARSALKYVGYRARPGGVNDFSRRVGYSGHEIPWSGAFVDCVIQDAGIFAPSCVYSLHGLGEFTRCRRVFDSPEPGDIVFFNFSTKISDPFSMSHVGIVVVTDAWKQSRIFTTVEGGLENSVRQLTRTRDDVLAFARPVVKGRPALGIFPVQTGDGLVDVNKVRPGRKNADVLNCQLALNKVLEGCSLTPNGEFNEETLRAFARWQRVTGYVLRDATGLPNAATVRLLGQVSGVFSTGGSPSDSEVQTG